MAESTKYSWEDQNFLDDVAFKQEDAKAFQALLGGRDVNDASSEVDFSPGILLQGQIVEISKDFAVVDVGLKSEGLVPIGEFLDPKELQVGQRIEVLLEDTEDESGQIVLSRERARRQRQWEHILEQCEEGSIVEGTITRKVKGGLMVDIGMEAFLPGSQIDNRRIKNLDEFIGKSCDFKILKINIERKNVVVSRREVVERERLEKRAEMLQTMEVGDLVTGVVKNITDFGVFLDLDGIDGLLHITDMTWKRIRHPSELVQLGQKLEVVVLNIDSEKGRIALGWKQKDPNPWEAIRHKYPVGTIVKGKITSLVNYGAFMEIEPGIEGLIHVSEMSWTQNVTDPEQIVAKGDEVTAIVLSVDEDDGKISLGMKQVERNPWEDVESKYPIGSLVEGEVRNLTNYGAFVALGPGIDGLIHISDLSWTKKISHPSEVLSVGDKVRAVVLTVDRESKKITLGVKQLEQDPWESVKETIPVGSIVKGKVSKIAAFGAFIKLDRGLEALAHVTELSNKPFSKVEDVVKVGDDVTARVIRIDPELKKIAVSIKDLTSSGGAGSDEFLMGDEHDTVDGV
ncbi:MAG: 30S ribosomal protein S1 [Verrucomicrobia bacterium]|nr:30S ribosomal protein S1 [Verrucomicrobiota bacterium]